ncbi:hypothetical protein GCM10010965_19600 [Caldalkalibacillus thermarum]|uniref:hypothetical protein n=1 Tax=Caldalkalibacillus thermarum TaxID=296745 RepID=UPI00166E82F6|nr:hypothetical protein [Caldalkalibacillus thermarum]GGK26934.1 hypothetical protein GCM10010965_19600 [Caldalkalibacillus thermarum]
MAFGITRKELNLWKRKVEKGEIAFITHYWVHPRYPQIKTVTKVGCADMDKLIAWGKKEGLDPEWIDPHPRYPHFDLISEWQRKILYKYRQYDQIERFNI